MTVALVISILLTVIAVIIVLGGLVWAAREDGRFQEEHDRFVTRRRWQRDRRAGGKNLAGSGSGSEGARRLRRQRH